MTAVGSVPNTRRADDLFFPLVAVLMLACVIVGFARSYFLAGMLSAHLPSLLVHIHALFFVGWALVATAQPLLVAIGKTQWHTGLGLTAFVFAVALPVLGLLTLYGAVRSHNLPPQFEDLISTLDVVFLIDFVALIVLGLRARGTDSSSHKRLMYLATVSLLAPAITRFPFDFSLPELFGIQYAFVVALLVFDLAALRKPHRATLLGGAIILISHAIGFALLTTPLPHDVVAALRR
jgi:hypothetical protein